MSDDNSVSNVVIEIANTEQQGNGNINKSMSTMSLERKIKQAVNEGITGALTPPSISQSFPDVENPQSPNIRDNSPEQSMMRVNLWCSSCITRNKAYVLQSVLSVVGIFGAIGVAVYFNFKCEPTSFALSLVSFVAGLNINQVKKN